MDDTKMRRTTRRVTVTTLEVSGPQIIRGLRAAGYIPTEVHDRAVQLTVEVPSGADYSGVRLDVGEDDTKLLVTWTEEEETVE